MMIMQKIGYLGCGMNTEPWLDGVLTKKPLGHQVWPVLGQLLWATQGLEMTWQEKKKMYVAVHLKSRVKNKKQLRSQSNHSEFLWNIFTAEFKELWLTRVCLSLENNLT